MRPQTSNNIPRAGLCWHTAASLWHRAHGGIALQELDTRGLACPLPLLKAKQALNRLSSGEQLRVMATDPGSQRDFRVFAEQSGNVLIESSVCGDEFHFLLQKR